MEKLSLFLKRHLIVILYFIPSTILYLYLIRNPQALGKPLSANLSGLYSYRFGDYRIIYKTMIPKQQILVLYIGHRKDIYVG